MTSFGAGSRVKFFHDQGAGPQVQAIGDIVILRAIARKPFAGGHVLLSNWGTQSIVYPHGKIPVPAFGAVAYTEDKSCPLVELKTPPGNNVASPEMRLYVIHLRQWALTNLDQHAASVQNIALAQVNAAGKGTAAPQNAPTGPKTKFSLLSHVQHGRYYDLVGEVRKIYASPERKFADLYITDYTENVQFFDYQRNGSEMVDGQDGDEFNYAGNGSTPKTSWSGPFGKRTMQIRCWAPHDSAVVEVGDFVFVKNTHVRCKEGNRYLEGTLYEDRLHPDQVDLRPFKSADRSTNPQLADLIHRREEFLGKEESGAPVPPKKVKLTRVEKRKKKKLADNAAAAIGKRLKTGDGETITAEASFDPTVSESMHGNTTSWLNQNGKYAPPYFIHCPSNLRNQ
jgi:protection-of-telomeres protein 1